MAAGLSGVGRPRRARAAWRNRSAWRARAVRPVRLLTLGLLVALLAAACAAAAPASSLPAAPASVAIVPAEPGLSAAEATAVTLLRRQLASIGRQFSPVSQPVQPAVPPALATVPVVVYRIELADPDQGFVLIYDLASPTAAATAARALASFVGSGFGQTTYPADATFSVASLGAAVIFTWWSPGLSSDPIAAEAAFERVAAVGTAVPVTK